MKKITLSCIIILQVFVLLNGFAAADEQKDSGPLEKVTLRLPQVEVDLYGLILLADEQGYFEENGLDITFIQGPSGLSNLKALRQEDDVDLAVAAEFPFVGEYLGGNRLKIIASVAHADFLHLIGRRDQGIHQPPDLQGKKIAVPLGTQLEFFLARFLLYYGLTFHDVKVIDLFPSEGSRRIIEGGVDAIIFKEPFITQIKEQLGTNAVSWPVQGEQAVYEIVASRARFVEQHPETSLKFLQALRQAELLMETQPHEAREMMLKRAKLDPKMYENVLATIQYELSLKQSLLIAMENEARWLIGSDQTETETMPNFLEAFYFEGLEAVKPDGVNIIHKETSP